MALDAEGGELRGGLRRCFFSRFVCVKSKANAFHFRFVDGLKKFVGEIRRAVSAGHRLHAVAVKGEGVDDAFSQDDFPTFESFGVKNSRHRSG